MKLYEINNAIERLLLVDDWSYETAEKLNELDIKRDEKILSIGCLVKDLHTEIDARKSEIEKQKTKINNIENKIEWLKNYVLCYADTNKYADERITLSIVDSQPSVEIKTNIENIPAEFVVEKTEKKINKIAIKDHLKNNGDQDYAELRYQKHVRVK